MKALSKFLSTLHFIWSAIVFFIAMILAFPFVIICKIIFTGKMSQDAAFIFLRAWGIMFSVGSFILYRTKKRELINPKKAYIFVANHSSYLDSVAIVRAIPQSFKPLAKIEMSKVPVFGAIYKRVVVMIDRSSKESREKSVSELRKELNNGQSILIFPEGTMNKTGKPLADFYDGAFRIAIETQTPLMPLVIKNSANLLPRSNPLAIKPGIVDCEFLPEIPVAGLTTANLGSLKSEVKKIMFDRLTTP